MKIEHILQTASKKLKAAGYEDSYWQVKVIAAYLLGCSPGNVTISISESKISSTFEQDFQCLLNKVVEGIPLQHVIKEWDFFGRTFKVDSRALIPRPETELLIDYILKQNIVENSLILDVGTGSGIIALTLAIEFPSSKVIATDISYQALTLAQENERLLQVDNCFFVQTNLIQGLTGYFNLIVANLPYIPTVDLSELDSIVLNSDPLLALDGGKAGITIIERLINSAQNHIYSNGFIVLETGDNQSEIVSNLFAENFWHKPVCYNDLAGKHRMVVAVRR